MVFFAAAGTTLALDQLSKALILRWLSPEISVPVLGDWIRLSLTHNTGSAFGLIGSPWLAAAIGGLVSAAVLVFALRQGLCGGLRFPLPLGLIFGGSLGNLVDRARTRGVTDFIDFRVWPVFNVADVALTAGVVLLAIHLIRSR